MITGLDHLALVTTDAARAAKFYTEVLGFKETGRLELGHTGTIYFVSLGDVQIELFGTGDASAPVGAADSTGFKHLAMLVDDLEAECARLKAAGVTFTTEPTVINDHLRIAFFLDPEGNALELMQKA